MNDRSARGFGPYKKNPILTTAWRRVARSRTTPLAAAVFAALYPASLTFAQTAQTAKPDSGRLEEIIVTATRRELNLQEVAQNVTAFTTEDIEKQAFQDVMDVIAALPSVVLNQNQPGRNAIVIRGVSTGARDYRTDSQVSVYLDDQPLTSASLQVDIVPIDIERIEVMPGPQGTLFGSSSQTGTMRYITNKPDPSASSSQADFEVGTTKGGEASYSTSGYVNIPLADTFAVRVVGFYSKEGGYTDNVEGPMMGGYGGITNANVAENNWNDYETYGGRIQARWQISPQWETTLSFVNQAGHADGVWESDPALGDYNMTKFFDEYRDDTWWQGSLNVKGDLGFADLSVTASYFDRNIKYEWDNSLYDLYRNVTLGSSYDLYNTDLEFGTTYNKQKQNRYTAEIRLTSKGDSRFQWMAGAFYEDVYDWWHYGTAINNLTSTTAWEQAQYLACYANSLGYDIQCPLPDTKFYYSDYFDRTIKQTAVFGEMTYDLTDKWSVTGGARWFQYDRDGFDVYSTPLGLPVWNGDGPRYAESRIESKGKSDDTVFKFATQYQFTPEMMAYALYSEGFRLGGTNAPRAAETGFIPFEYKPDKLHNYELGFKSQWLENRLQVNVDFFFMQWDDFQLRARAGHGQPFWVRGIFNGGQVEQKGAEFNISAQVTERLSIEASAFFGDPEFSEATTYPSYDPDDPDPSLIIPAGSKLPISPDRKFFVSANYEIPQFLGTNGKAWTRISWSYNSEIYNTIDGAVAEDPTDLIPSWSQTNLQLGYTHNNGWETALIARNLFDEKGINWLSTSYYGDIDPFTDSRFHYLRTLQKPLTVSLSFTKKWK